MAKNLRQRKVKQSPPSDDLREKRSKTVATTSRGINPLLILLLVCVVLTWGIAATLIFNLVDYKAMLDWAKNLAPGQKTANLEEAPAREEVVDVLPYPIV